MEPSPSRPLAVPKLHLLFQHGAQAAALRTDAPEAAVAAAAPEFSTSQQQQQQQLRGGSSDRSGRHQPTSSNGAIPGPPKAKQPLAARQSPRFSHPTPPRTAAEHAGGVVVPPRASTATVEYLEAAKLPPMLQRQLRDPPHCSATADASASLRADEDAFCVLHPALDLTDDSGELSKLMLRKWSLDAGEHAFASISLFCEVKLNEAKRMASWVETPNRFVATICCQLLGKYIDRIGAASSPRPARGNNCGPSPGGGSGGLGHSAAFLRLVLSELADAVFLPASRSQPGAPDSASSAPFDDRVPYFVEFKRLKKHNQFLLDTLQNRDRAMTTRERLPGKVERLLARTHSRSDRSALKTLFRAWAKAIATDKEIRSLKCRVFRSVRKTNLSSIFRAWRIESLRRAYQRESADYQTMLSITAASLSRKDVLIAEAESKVTSMAKIIDSLTTSNAQLMHRIGQLEASLAAGLADDGPAGDARKGGGVGAAPSAARRHDVQFEHIDTLIAQDDERMDRINRMLLETMFGMARMVESCAIQMSKDVMDSLEYQLDGSVLQNLAEMIQAENVVKAKIEAGASRDGDPQGSDAPRARGGVVHIKDLAHMPVDALLLHWVRMNLQMSSAIERASDRTIKNFTSDLADGRRLSFLLHRLFPTWFDASMVHEIDADQRLRNIETFHHRIQPELPQVVSSDSIHAESVTENVSFVAMLFGAGSIQKINLERQRGAFLNIITSWKRVRSLLLEVKRMHDNYDALMVVHLMKEMRTCETLFKQLNGELAAIAIASNETSSALSKIAYKILGLTWRCLHARATNQVAALEIVDERWQERVKDFALVDVGSVRELLVADSEIQHQMLNRARRGSSVGMAMAPVVPERDVQQRTDALRSVLAIYSKDLHDIFKHYSASGGAGSIASMSLAEYNKFVKDCAICEKGLTPSAAESIFRAAMLHSPLNMLSDRHRDPAATALESSSSASDATEEPREMVGREFVDALLRIAAVKFADLSLEARFQELMEQTILPNALRSQSEIFRAEVASPKLRAVFQKHKAALQRVFRYYTSMHAMREQQSTLSLRDFAVFAKDCKLIGSFITEHTLKQVLVNLQRDVEPGSEDDLRADFGDFMEAIAALTEYVICNPYVPLYKRVEQFVNELLLPRARQKK